MTCHLLMPRQRPNRPNHLYGRFSATGPTFSVTFCTGLLIAGFIRASGPGFGPTEI